MLALDLALAQVEAMYPYPVPPLVTWGIAVIALALAVLAVVAYRVASLRHGSAEAEGVVPRGPGRGARLPPCDFGQEERSASPPGMSDGGLLCEDEP